MPKSAVQVIFNLSVVILAAAIAYCLAYPLLEGYDHYESRLALGLDLVSRSAEDYAKFGWAFWEPSPLLFLQPQDPEILGPRTTEYLESIEAGDYLRAKKIVEAALKDAPDQFMYHACLADIDTMLGQDSEALLEYQYALVLAPEEWRGWINQSMGFVLFRLGRYKAAWESLETAATYSEYPEWADIEKRAEFCYQIGAYNCSIDYWGQAIPLFKSPLRDYYQARATAEDQLGYVEAAISDYTASIEQFQENNRSYYNRAELYWDSKQYEQATDDWLACVAGCPDWARELAAARLGCTLTKDRLICPPKK